MVFMVIFVYLLDMMKEVFLKVANKSFRTGRQVCVFTERKAQFPSEGRRKWDQYHFVFADGFDNGTGQHQNTVRERADLT